MSPFSPFSSSSSSFLPTRATANATHSLNLALINPYWCTQTTNFIGRGYCNGHEFHLTLFKMPGAEGAPQTLYDKVLQAHIVDEKLDGTLLIFIGQCLRLRGIAPGGRPN